jgi:hypothetical protein
MRPAVWTTCRTDARGRHRVHYKGGGQSKKAVFDQASGAQADPPILERISRYPGDKPEAFYFSGPDVSLSMTCGETATSPASSGT